MTTATQTIPKGYKQTEIGMIPADWTVTTLLELSVDGISNGVFNDPTKVGKGYRLINVLDLYKGHSIDTRNLSRLELSATDFIKKKVKKGDIFFTRSSITPDGIAFCNFCNEEADDITFDGHVMKLTPNPKIINPAFLRLYCISKVARKYLVSSAKQTTMTTIGQSDIAKLPVILPSLIEQSDIATSISDIDALIEKLDKLIEKKKNIKQGAMQELVTGRRRLPGFSGKWETKKLGELLDYEQPTEYLVKHANYSDDFNIPVLTAGKTFVLGYTAEETGIFQNLPTIIFDDFTTAIKYVDFPFKAKSSAMKMLIPRSKEINLKFIFAKMQMIDFQLGDHKRHWIAEYQNIEIATPKPDEQTAIATVLSDMDTEIEKLDSQLTKYQNLKQGMMQTLLTGKIRLLSK